MRQTRVAGEKLFVDYAGDTVPVVVDRLRGETRAAELFVAVLGASSCTDVQATWQRANYGEAERIAKGEDVQAAAAYSLSNATSLARSDT